MITFSSFISEARRNPISKTTGKELNPKVSLASLLKPFKNDPNVFVSYVSDVGASSIAKGKNISGFKIGINPKSGYATPNGIYTYPVEYLFKDFYDSLRDDFVGVPFAGDQPYAYALRPKRLDRVLELHSYNSSQWDKDYIKLSRLLMDYYQKNPSKLPQADTSKRMTTPTRSSLLSSLRLSDDKPEKIAKEKLDSKTKNMLLGWEAAKAILDAASKDARDKSPGGRIWNMSRITFLTLIGQVNLKLNTLGLAFVAVMSNKTQLNLNDKTVRMSVTYDESIIKQQKKSTALWSKILRDDLGYDAVVDRKGKGIIHPAEETQAVFLHPTNYDIVASGYNKSYYKIDSPSYAQRDVTLSGSNPAGDADFIEVVNKLLAVNAYSYSEVKQLLLNTSNRRKIILTMMQMLKKASLEWKTLMTLKGDQTIANLRSIPTNEPFGDIDPDHLVGSGLKPSQLVFYGDDKSKFMIGTKSAALHVAEHKAVSMSDSFNNMSMIDKMKAIQAGLIKNPNRFEMPYDILVSTSKGNQLMKDFEEWLAKFS